MRKERLFPENRTVWISHWRFFFLLLLFRPVVQAEEMWVWGSWVNVRESADARSAVIDHVTTNTTVETGVREGGMCEIEWSATDARKHGFVACRLLGKRPLTLEETSREYLANALQLNPQYSPPRAFWISPSMRALINAGEYFERTLLSSKQNELEQNVSGVPCREDGLPPIVRYPIPEFDAMKALLEKGIVAGRNENQLLLDCAQVRARNMEGNWQGEQLDTLEEWLERLYFHSFDAMDFCYLPENGILALPKIRSSFFKDENILPGTAPIEQISAHFGIIERLRVTGGPYWAESHYDSIWLVGAWDIGFYDLTLAQPVFEHVIGSDGQIGIHEWTPKVSPMPGYKAWKEKIGIYYYVECEEGRVGFNNQRRASKHVSGSPVEEALFWFQSPTVLPLQKAKVAMKKPHEDITVHEVDLDHDGIPDFVHWHFEDEKADYYNKHRVVFINIDGVWYPFERDRYEVCTGG
ncbi:MAG: hypothetical protein LBE85_02135 [Candidatus Accumulibacter sp.]|nr:hypothetical protein [Accumulibacter sp.]